MQESLYSKQKMEFPKLISRSIYQKHTRRIWQVKVKMDSEINKVYLIFEKGKLGKKLVHKEICLNHAKISAKKGINSLQKYGEVFASKLYEKKLRSGYEIYNEIKRDENNKNSNDNEENENENEKNNPNEKILDIKEGECNKIIKPKNSNTKINYKNSVVLNNTSNNSSNINKKCPNKYLPMLAHNYSVKNTDLKFPCYVQPKINGVRCVAVGKNLYSKNGNLFPDLPNIQNELSEISENIILDGELYSTEINYDNLTTVLRKTNKNEEEINNSSKINFYVFDCIEENMVYEKRIEKLYNFFINHPNFKFLHKVKTEICNSQNEIFDYLEKYTKEGYEGVIIRNKLGRYAENSRSSDLLKLKKFDDEEFEIVDFTTPKSGREVGCITWVCKTKEGNLFNVRPKASYDDRKKWFKEGKKFIGKKLTVKYQRLTHNNVPRFPIGMGVRDYE